MSRGRPLGIKSAALLSEWRAQAQPLTSREVAARFQLSRTDALATCSRLAGAGHLVVIGLVSGSGQRPASVYAPADHAPAPAVTVILPPSD